MVVMLASGRNAIPVTVKAPVIVQTNAMGWLCDCQVLTGLAGRLLHFNSFLMG